jgi:hypothetical protein
MKMSARDKIMDYFGSKYESDTDDAKAAFSYGVCCFALYLYAASDRVKKHNYLLTGISAFTDCLRIHYDWWLARYFRSEATQELPDGLRQMSIDLRSHRYKFIEPNEDRLILIKQQKEEKAEPYFLSPYVSMTKSYLYQGKIEEALASFHDGLRNAPLIPVRYEISALSKPYHDVVLLLRKLNLSNEADAVKSAARELFPLNASLVMV